MSTDQETSFLNFANKMLSEASLNKEFLTVKMLLDDPSCPFSEKALRFHYLEIRSEWTRSCNLPDWEKNLNQESRMGQMAGKSRATKKGKREIAE